VRASITASRHSVQLLVAMCLIAGLTAVVLVALSSPARAIVAQDIHNVLNLAGAFVTKLFTLASSVIAVTRYGPCGASAGPC